MSNRLNYLANLLSDRIGARWRSQRALSELSALDDYTLADIGLTRADIPYIVMGAEPFRGRGDGHGSCGCSGA
jgi:uncharacterized protein YjiS (DUF1127 family)